MALLEVRRLVVGYGRVVALHGVDVRVERGEIVTLVGANGAGKSALMRAVSGLRPVTSGRILYAGEDITALRADLRVTAGISHVPEGRGIFPGMSVLENLLMGAYAVRDRRARHHRHREDLDRVLDLFPRLRQRRDQAGGTLSGGEQQMLAIGRALMARPELLLLDEPSMGLAPRLVRQIFAIVRDLAGGGTTVLVVEQNARQALRIADRAYVLEAGEVTREGTGRELLADPAVQAAYLGGVPQAPVTGREGDPAGGRPAPHPRRPPR